MSLLRVITMLILGISTVVFFFTEARQIEEVSALFWIEEGGTHIHRLDLSNGADLSFDTGSVMGGLFFNRLDHKLYWGDQTTFSIMRSNPDGSNRELVAITNGKPTSIDVDYASNTLFWTLKSKGIYSCANIPCYNPKLIFHSPGMTSYADIGVDSESGRIYFSNLDGIDDYFGVGAESAPGIYRIPLAKPLNSFRPFPLISRALLRCNGSPTNEILCPFFRPSDTKLPTSFSIDKERNNIYWVATEMGKILQCAIPEIPTFGIYPDCNDRPSSSPRNKVFTIVANLIAPMAIRVDKVQRKLYWSEHGSESIKRSNFDGSEIEVLLEKATLVGTIALGY